MTDNAIHEMIAAFAAGCMDKENFVQFKDFILAGGDLPNSELGELQNIVAMIPIILDIEKPDRLTKESVARKLISIKDEIKTKIREEKQKTITRTVKKPSATSFKGLTQMGTLSEVPHTKVEAFQPKKPTEPTKIAEKFESPEENPVVEKKEPMRNFAPPEQPQSLLAYQVPHVQPPASQDKSGSNFAGWIAILLTITLFSILGYYTYSSIDSLNTEMEDLKQNVTALRSELGTANNFISNYVSVIDFFNNKDISVIDLSSADPRERATARVFLTFDKKEGLVQFKNVKQLQPNQGYQLWAVSRGISYSMGVYIPNGHEYLRLTSFPLIPKERIDALRVTIESNTGSPTPSIRSFLVGTFTSRGRIR